MNTVARNYASTTPTFRPATEKQLGWLKTLFAERAASEAAQAIRTALLGAYKTGTLSATAASQAIDAVKLIDRDPKAAPVPAASTVAVPDGRYAIAPVHAEDIDDLVFYSVETSEKWGRSVKQIIGGDNDRYVARKLVASVLARIDADTYARPTQHGHDDDGDYTLPAGTFSGAEGAALRYADHFTRCGRCNRQLTNRQSRLDGIGPVCITKGE